MAMVEKTLALCPKWVGAEPTLLLENCLNSRSLIPGLGLGEVFQANHKFVEVLRAT